MRATTHAAGSPTINVSTVEAAESATLRIFIKICSVAFERPTMFAMP